MSSSTWTCVNTDDPMNELLTARGDIAKCVPDHPCPLQEACLRNLRPPAPYQAYSCFEHWLTDECAGFIPVDSWGGLGK